eukprot:7789114-Alexandrium_andersonii.AAC.1
MEVPEALPQPSSGVMTVDLTNALTPSERALSPEELGRVLGGFFFQGALGSLCKASVPTGRACGGDFAPRRGGRAGASRRATQHAGWRNP